tara:strand:- start:122 stop:706 length:585 start_codon:yes stop_codon:yes gene_type:complete
LFFSILLIAHFQAAIIPILLGIKSINKFKYIKYNKFLPYGFIFLGLASISEMLDHTQTYWIYVDHSSLFNWLFYSFLSLGLTFLSISVIKNKLILTTCLFISLCSIISYFLFGKTIALLFQVIISIFLIINWQRTFKDWLFVLYPIFGIFFTTFFGTNLSKSGDQFWHLLIGPSGTISVLSFYLVLKRSEKKFT